MHTKEVKIFSFYLRSGSWTCLCSGRGDGRGLELALVFNVFSTIDTMSRHPCTKDNIEIKITDVHVHYTVEPPTRDTLGTI